MQNSTRNRARRDRFVDPPATELSHAVDDEEDPTEVTVFAETSDDVTTSWLTMDVDHVVDLHDAV